MNENRLGPRAFFAALAIAASTLLGLAATAQADDAQPTLYHVLESTFGCGDPSVTRMLTDPGETRRSNSNWLRNTIASGRCVTITPRSPWKLVSQDNGVALMEYAGTVGAPGSYYIAVNELVDAVGKHPGEGVPAPAPGQSNAAANSATPQGSTTSETALAPSFPDNGAAAQSAMPHGNWSTLDVILLLVAISIAGVVGYVVGRNTRD
ncbi:MAG TPA: hypothetical protein VL899_03845 [Alphaproteobacteria bacterium]|nr:hypothetical protein [Alphaproteobacteria bacterium]